MKRETARLLFFASVVIGVPALLNQVLPAKKHFDSRPLERLRSRQPQVVLISDSTLDNGVDPALMTNELGGRRVELLWHGGAASASWYLMLKNYVIASGVRPELVCILFRDRTLSEPAFRTTGPYRSEIESEMHEEEPVYRLVLGEGSTPKHRVERWVERVFPLSATRHAHQEKIERTVSRWIAATGLEVNAVERKVNETFALQNLRAEANEEANAISRQAEVDFDPDPGRSFLPHMIDLAARAQVRLCFLRVKRYPEPDGRVRQSESLRRYISDLRNYLESRGCCFIDDADEAARTADMFLRPGDDHMSVMAKRRSTELYAQKLRPFLP